MSVRDLAKSSQEGEPAITHPLLELPCAQTSHPLSHNWKKYTFHLFQRSRWLHYNGLQKQITILTEGALQCRERGTLRSPEVCQRRAGARWYKRREGERGPLANDSIFRFPFPHSNLLFSTSHLPSFLKQTSFSPPYPPPSSEESLSQ